MVVVAARPARAALLMDDGRAHRPLAVALPEALRPPRARDAGRVRRRGGLGRAARVFGFDYRIEVYTPGPKRVHGYYVLPILHHGHLIGRLDAKAHRVERRLEVRHVHFEPWFASAQVSPAGWGRVDQDEALAGLAEALGSLAAFVGAAEVEIGRVTPRRLRAPLVRSGFCAPDPVA